MRSDLKFRKLLITNAQLPLLSVLFLCILCDAGGGDAAGNQYLSEGIATQTVSAVDAARHLTCGIEAWYRLAVGIQHVALLIHHQSAHGMVCGRCQRTYG